MQTFGTGAPAAIDTQTPSEPHGLDEQVSTFSHV
jgi:hypothetical protein